MSTLISSPTVSTDRYFVRMAENQLDLHTVQRLRFEVFNLELDEGLASSKQTGLDRDEYDEVCTHLLVIERATSNVVGTYRMQTGAQASQALGYYSEQEFDFAPFASVRGQVLELGRACIAAAHRNQTVLALLWKSIISHSRRHGLRYLIGCSSLSSQDEAAALVTYEGLKNNHLADERWRTFPREFCRCRPGPAEPLAVPRLMAAYLSAGCKICGEPAIDREFGTIDFLTLQDLENTPPRFARKYLA